MIFVGILFVYLAIWKKIETALFLPLGIGTLLMNFPGSDGADGILRFLFEKGIHQYELFPLVLFLGIGTMTDFSPLIKKPAYLLLGIICQSGILFAIILARILGMDMNDAVSAGIIGAADGPTAIIVGKRLGTKYLAAVTVASYSYMAMVPLLQPMVLRLLVSKKEGEIPCRPIEQSASRRSRIIFPIVAILVCGFTVPGNVSLLVFLLLGNLIRECGLLDGVTNSMRIVAVDVVTVFLALGISWNMKSSNFMNPDALKILSLGLFAFLMNIACGLVAVKIFNLLAGLFHVEKINPIIASAGISAFPIATRIAQREASKRKGDCIILGDALAVNCAGQLASVLAGGILLSVAG